MAIYYNNTEKNRRVTTNGKEMLIKQKFENRKIMRAFFAVLCYT